MAAAGGGAAASRSAALTGFLDGPGGDMQRLLSVTISYELTGSGFLYPGMAAVVVSSKAQGQ